MSGWPRRFSVRKECLGIAHGLRIAGRICHLGVKWFTFVERSLGKDAISQLIIR